jgi:hypothetical protein
MAQVRETKTELDRDRSGQRQSSTETEWHRDRVEQRQGMRQSREETGEKRGVGGEIHTVVAQGLNGEITGRQRQIWAETRYGRDRVGQR